MTITTLLSILNLPLKPAMTRRRTPTVSSSAASDPAEYAPSTLLASQLGGLELGGENPQPALTANPNPPFHAAAPAAALSGGKSASSGGGAGPSSSPAAPFKAVASPDILNDASPAPPPAEEEKKTSACCTLVIAGKVFTARGATS